MFIKGKYLREREKRVSIKRYCSFNFLHVSKRVLRSSFSILFHELSSHFHFSRSILIVSATFHFFKVSATIPNYPVLSFFCIFATNSSLLFVFIQPSTNSPLPLILLQLFRNCAFSLICYLVFLTSPI